MYNELGEKVRKLRVKRKLNQDVLAETLNLSRSQISNLESGKRNISIKQLEKICELFNVDMSYFFMDISENTCIDLIEKARLIFESKKISKTEKHDVFCSIMSSYLDSVDKK